MTAADARGVEKTATTDDEGNYAFTALPPGSYTVRVAASGFGLYENIGVEVTAGRTEPLDIVLTVVIEQEEVTVTAESPVSTDPEGQAGAVVLRGEDLDSLPDDPEDLSEALQALAGPRGRPQAARKSSSTASRAGVCRRKSPSLDSHQPQPLLRLSTTASAMVASRFSPSPARTSTAPSLSTSTTRA